MCISFGTQRQAERQRNKPDLKKINAESFSTKDWQDALEYFTDVREEIQDKKSAKAYLEA